MLLCPVCKYCFWCLLLLPLTPPLENPWLLHPGIKRLNSNRWWAWPVQQQSHLRSVGLSSHAHATVTCHVSLLLTFDPKALHTFPWLSGAWYLHCFSGETRLRADSGTQRVGFILREHFVKPTPKLAPVEVFCICNGKLC